jgi:UDP-glucuronate decarboxylase
VEGLVKLMETGDEITGPVNLGNPVEFSIHKLAQKVLDITGSHSRIEYQQLPQDDPRQRQPDIRLAKELLGWEPQVPLEQGLVPTIAHFEDLLKRGLAQR